MRFITLATLAALAATPAMAGDHRVAPVRDPLVQQECGQCHMVFQPGLLPAQSWEKMMAGLANHFGDDASMTPERTATIRNYMVANAGRVRHGDVPERITQARWFVHEHDLPEKVWKRPDVMTKSNCAACHRGAEQGFYDDD